LLLNLGKFEEALLPLQTAIEQNPKKASAFTKLGGALKNLGRDEAGDAALKYAADLSPDQADLENATMLFAKGKFREAEVVAKKIIEKNPRDVNAALLLGRIAINARAFSDAEQIFRKIVDIAPRFMLAWHDLSTALKEQDKEEDAEQVLQSAISIDPDNAISHYYLAAVFAKLGKTEDSAKSYKHATDLDPKLVGAHLGLGHVLKTLGDVDAGIAAYRQAIALRPNFGEIYFSLSNLKTFRFTDDEIEDMASRIDQENLDTDSVVHFAFSLGKAYEDSKDYDKAFEYYLRGNEEHRNLISYDPVQTELAHEKLKETFTEEFFAKIKKSDVGNSDSSPIFIIGLPRSGSTLLEQILASHSQVQGTSELPDLGIVSQMISNKAKGRAFPGGILQMSNEEITHLGDEYIRRTKRYRSGTPFFTDKMPNNFAHVGLLSAILPNAKVIDARRHPLDSCVGSFKQHFAKGQTFTYDMFELGEFYLHYDNLMCHWNEVLPGKVLRVQYEDVVQNLDAQVERILDHCGLPFEEACVNFHETKRSVRTASSEQVRQPIYSGSVNTWQRFDSHLEPLKDILEPLLDANDPSVILR
jgi:tetratricopeptide (TPR) repeat protein